MQAKLLDELYLKQRLDLFEAQSWAKLSYFLFNHQLANAFTLYTLSLSEFLFWNTLQRIVF